MNLPAEYYLTHTLREKPWGSTVSRILAASVAAVDPAAAVQRVLQKDGSILVISKQKINLDDFRNVYILAIGKAGISMAAAAADLLSHHLAGGMVLTKFAGSRLPERCQEKIKVFFGGHPIPDQDSLKSTEQILSKLSNLSNDDLVLVLISGGGSALLTSPAPGISLTDLQQANQLFLESGLNIKEINTIRKHISRAKGGKLAEILHPARTITLILSDVLGDPIDMIASGPTAPDPTTYNDALDVIRRYNLKNHLPLSIYKHLSAGIEGMVKETPKPGDPIFQDQIRLVIAGIQNAMNGGFEQAQGEGFKCQILPDPLEGEARQAGEKLARYLLQASVQEPSIKKCFIAGGETTVTLAGSPKPGKGGRNLELALSAVRHLAGQNNLALVTLATDGEDGVTDAAGAIVTGDSLLRAEERGLNPDTYLAEHDSYVFFQTLGDLLLPGSTGTNVNDLCFLFTF